MSSLSISTRIAAPPDTVFSVMSDHRRYANWGRRASVTLDVEGEPAPNGLGAVRTFHVAGPWKSREEVVAWDPPRLMAYTLVSGLPIRDYRSEMKLRADGDATVLDWSSTFEPKIPRTGRLFERFLTAALRQFAQGIKTDAEAEARA